MSCRTKLERLPQVLHTRGCGRAKHYKDVTEGLWVKPVRLGDRYSVYPSNETDILIAAQIAGKSKDEIRALVCKLHAARSGGM